ncbi:hypothetical protein [Mesorhizobium sp.]|uniref:hypothetical protein n=1 Tax=Mesorhizobium sp. TaxID=1871066 RepID=UPI000FE4DB74|nr:hypothetical protein [Mesorhizobium sp.]RWF01604.1 MAG: helix-turn-helix domain-containing protein [Mesorhizobium sp.]RWF55202.1 MAG: helix-turn-helix domain-containing protein [Mesorhizobium sp.]
MMILLSIIMASDTKFLTVQEGFEGLLRDKTRPSRIPPLVPDVAERVVALTLENPPADTTHWTADMMAKVADISQRRPAHLECARASAPPLAAVQALQRSESSSINCAMSSGFTLIRRPTPSYCRLMKNRRSRRWTGPSLACP